MTGRKKTQIQFVVVLGYIFFTAICYWTILSGQNLMKWDIWQAEYPLQVMMSDAIADGTLPLWNPLMNMGMPYYASVGMPVWYPVTLLLACFGYTPQTIAVEYCIHLVVAAYGAFLLVKNHLSESGEKTGTIIAAFCGGLVYAGSGLFLSNAQHIMIIISAAWFPWILYFVKRFLQEKKGYLAMLAGLCAGLVMQGGYPEMFYDIFLILVPYTLAMCWEKKKSIWRNIFSAAVKYIIVCICTVFACAVTLIPFLHLMPYMTRGADTQRIPLTVPFINLLSLFLPKAGAVLKNVEISMCNFYMGLWALIGIPTYIKSKSKNKWFYTIMFLVTFEMCWGSSSILYMFLHKLFPMYQTFRFPPVCRAFATLFLIVMMAEGWRKMITEKVSFLQIILTMILGFAGAICWWIAGRITIGAMIMPSWADGTKIASLQYGGKVLLFICVCYIITFLVQRINKIPKYIKHFGIVGTLCIELFLFVRSEIPITIALFDAETVQTDESAQKFVQDAYLQNQTRKRQIEFAGAQRTSNRLVSSNIVFNKTFDDEGYLSVKLQDTENYKKTYHHSITESNPVIYFTNQVQTAQQTELISFLEKPDSSPLDIYIESPAKSLPDDCQSQELTPQIISDIEMNEKKTGNDLSISGKIAASRNNARVWKVYVETDDHACDVKITFQNETDLYEYQGIFDVYYDVQGSYINIYFPKTAVDYTKAKVTVKNGVPVQSNVYYQERMSEVSNITVNHFGFNDIRVTTDVETVGYLTILQSNYPGWTAYVDGIKTEIETVNGAFMGIPLNEGKHEVVLEFEPIDFKVGKTITILYVLILFSMIMLKITKLYVKSKIR